MFALTIKSAFALFASAVAVVSASPAQKRDVFSPPIITPNAQTVWQVGSIQNVTWDPSNAPAHITETPAIVLAKNNIEDFEHPLATNFSLLTGTQAIQVPVVAPGSDYAIVLMGDASNLSPRFTIIL